MAVPYDLPRARAITDRLIQAVDFMIDRDRIDSARAFCRETGYTEPHFSRLRANREKTAPLWLISIVCEKYPIDPDWLLTGRGQMMVRTF